MRARQQARGSRHPTAPLRGACRRNDLGCCWLLDVRREGPGPARPRRLLALPSKISHHWRKGPHKPAGQGVPPYLSQVLFVSF
jgi:hypothetical protein